MDIEEICVGEYVRTTDGFILKVVGFNGDKEPVIDRYYNEGRHLNSFEIEHYVKNYSKNIIDLIEVGDYVNGSEVVTVYDYDEDGNDKDGLGICEVDDDYAYYTYLENINIKSIVTKEQYKSVEYVF